MGKCRRIFLGLVGRVILLIEHKVLGFLRGIYFRSSSDVIKWTPVREAWENISESSYDDAKIFESKISTLKAVIEGTYQFDRDSVGFSHSEWNLGVLGALLVASKNSDRKNIRVVDFGGGAASLYFQHREVIESKNIQWIVVEQEGLVRLIDRTILPSNLQFVSSLDMVSNEAIDLFICSGVLQYLPNPGGMLDKMSNLRPKVIFIDRTSETKGETQLTIQSVPSTIYKAEYPCWIFSPSFLNDRLAEKYQRMSYSESIVGTKFKTSDLSFVDMSSLWILK